MLRETAMHICPSVWFSENPFWPQEGRKVKPSAHLLITVPDDGQIKELASMLLWQDRVNTCSMWAGQLLIHCQIISWWYERELVFVKPERKTLKYYFT